MFSAAAAAAAQQGEWRDLWVSNPGDQMLLQIVPGLLLHGPDPVTWLLVVISND